MAANEYAEVDVSDWELLEIEPRGSKPNKEWLLQPGTEPRADTQARWLFKPRTRQRHRSVTFPKGDDWAEKMAGEIGRVLAIPSAVIELARRGSELGIVSADVSVGRDLVLGNVVLSQHDPRYPVDQRHGVAGYLCEARLRRARPAGRAISGAVTGWRRRVLDLRWLARARRPDRQHRPTPRELGLAGRHGPRRSADARGDLRPRVITRRQPLLRARPRPRAGR